MHVILFAILKHEVTPRVGVTFDRTQ